MISSIANGSAKDGATGYATSSLFFSSAVECQLAEQQARRVARKLKVDYRELIGPAWLGINRSRPKFVPAYGDYAPFAAKAANLGILQHLTHDSLSSVHMRSYYGIEVFSEHSIVIRRTSKPKKSIEGFLSLLRGLTRNQRLVLIEKYVLGIPFTQSGTGTEYQAAYLHKMAIARIREQVVDFFE